MGRLLKSDAAVYQKLSDMAQDMMDLRISKQFANSVGYKTAKSVRESLNRLENAGFIILEDVKVMLPDLGLSVRRAGV